MPQTVTPWWKALKIRQEIVGASGQIDDVQMSLFQAVYGLGGEKPLYADATYYGEITHPTERLTDLLAEIAIRVGGGADYQRARSVTRLDQGMGGGKSHACIGAYHLAAHPEALLRTELGKRVAERAQAKTGRALALDLGRPHVVVLPCDNMTPGAPTEALDGPAYSLYERFLWRLFKVGPTADYNLYERYKSFYSDKSKIAEAIRAINRPVLIIVDEILDYLGNGLDGAGKPELVAQDVAFLRALLDVVNDVPNVSMLVVMIASDADKTALSREAQARRDDLNSLLERNGTPATVTEVADFASILRRRLFDTEPAKEVLTATAELFRPTLEDKAWEKNVWSSINAGWRHEWDEQVAVCYPFHPSLMAMAKEEWSQVTGFQRVRSTIRIFAATVYSQQKRGVRGEWVPLLIGPGDLPLSDSTVREALLGSGLVEDDRTIANYRSLAENEVVNRDSTGGAARKQDIDRPQNLWSDSNPRATERAATFMFLTSIVGTLRPGRGRGASAPEVKAATNVPNVGYTVTDADQVLADLVDTDQGMSAIEIIPGQGNNKPARYFLSTRLTHRMLVANIRRTITDEERDAVIAEFAEKLSTNGPFREKRFIRADLEKAANDVLIHSGISTAHTTRLFILDPAQFSLRNGMEKETLKAITIAMGMGPGTDQIPVQWASSAVFSVVNTQRRAQARGSAVEYLARQKALSAPEVQNDWELKAQGTKEFNEGRLQLEKAMKRAYQHVVYLAQPDPAGERQVEQFTFDDDMNTALNGAMVWKELANHDKTFDDGQFDAKALLHNLRDGDYGKTIAEVRSSFYSAPRLPLLYNGDLDLAKAVYDAVRQGLLEIVDGAGESVAVTAANQVNMTATGLRLSKPRPPQATEPLVTNTDGVADPSGAGPVAPSEAVTIGPVDFAQPVENQLTFAFTRNLLNNTTDADRFAAFFKKLYEALDAEQLSYLQGTLTLQLDESVVIDMQRNLAELGIQANVKRVG